MGMEMKDRKQSKLDKRLKGYHRHFKGRYLLIKNNVLTFQEFILWDLSFSILADWDTSLEHEDIYGSFPQKFSEISYFLNCDPSNISRYSKKLFELGLWKRRNDGRIEVCGFNIIKNLSLITNKVGTVDLQDYIANPHIYNAFTQDTNEKKHGLSTKEPESFSSQTDVNLHTPSSKEPLVSYKDESSLGFDNDTNKVLTVEEAERIFSDDGLTEDDIKWIDENVKEIE